MQQNGSKYFAGRPPTQSLGSIGQHSTFSEHGHVAYQIKKVSLMQQHGRKYFASRPPANTGGLNVKIYVKRYNIYETYQT